MKSRKIFILLFLIVSGITHTTLVHAQFGDLFKGIKKVLGGKDLSENKIIQGLKEALEIGTGNAVNKVSQMDGYFLNPNIRIPLPEAVQKVKKLLQIVGAGPQIDEFELSMNRAAERAAPEAKALFLDAIKQMTFTDARKILQGGDNEATLYFKDKSYNELHEIFKPIIHKVMSEVGVTRKYQELDAKVDKIPFADRLGFDLDNYVTNKALDGLFLMVAEEERKIRRDPAARVSDLLKEIFGKK
jgi:RNA binding exosome subunit